MSDHDKRDGGGLAVAIIAGILVVLLLLCGGGGLFLFPALERDWLAPQRAKETAARNEAARAAAQAVRKEVAARPDAIETPAPSAPESPPPTQ